MKNEMKKAKQKLSDYVTNWDKTDPNKFGKSRNAIAFKTDSGVGIVRLPEYDPALLPDVLGKERYVRQRLGTILSQAISSGIPSSTEWFIR